MIEIKDLITLSDHHKYAVISKAIIDSVSYYFLVDVNDESNIKFCFGQRKEDRIELVEIENSEEIRNLLPLLAKNVEEEFKSLINNLFIEEKI